jgi:hypothetical protein
MLPHETSPIQNEYRRTDTSWRWFILSRWDDSEIASGQTRGIAVALNAVKKPMPSFSLHKASQEENGRSC